jgi:hypothetical protein
MLELKVFLREKYFIILLWMWYYYWILIPIYPKEGCLHIGLHEWYSNVSHLICGPLVRIGQLSFSQEGLAYKKKQCKHFLFSYTILTFAHSMYYYLLLVLWTPGSKTLPLWICIKPICILSAGINKLVQTFYLIFFSTLSLFCFYKNIMFTSLTISLTYNRSCK